MMKRQLLLALGSILLLAGWMSAFLLRSIPQGSDLYYFVPTLLLAVGMGLNLKILSGRMTAIVIALTAAAAILAINSLFPGEAISLAGLSSKIAHQDKPGKSLTIAVRDTDHNGVFSEERHLQAYADISVNLFARLPGPARMMTSDDVGDIYVSIPKLGAIYLLKDSDQDGYAEQPILFRAGLDRPHGLVWHKDSLYVAETDRLLVLKDTDQDDQVDSEQLILKGLPDDGGHWTRSLAMDQAGALYLSIGSRCNACEEQDERRASVLKVDPTSGSATIFAKGLRNSVGLAFAADGTTLWGSDNGRDMLGDDLPPDEINQLTEGGDYGWPHCFGQQIADPELGSKTACRQTLAAAVDLPAHSAPLGITFGTRLKAPEKFRNSLYVAFHGSWNRSVPTGYKVVRIPFAAGQPAGEIEEFLSGWLTEGKAWGRPVAPLVGRDGNLYLSDDRADAIYRIHWNKGGS